MDIAVAPDGQIATASFDNSVGLWTGKAPEWLEGNRAAVNTLIHPAPGVVYSGGDDFVVRGRSAAAQAFTEIGRHGAKITDLALRQLGRHRRSLVFRAERCDGSGALGGVESP